MVMPEEPEFGRLSYHCDPRLPSEFHLTKNEKVMLLSDLLNELDKFWSLIKLNQCLQVLPHIQTVQHIRLRLYADWCHCYVAWESHSYLRQHLVEGVNERILMLDQSELLSSPRLNQHASEGTLKGDVLRFPVDFLLLDDMIYKFFVGLQHV